MATPLVTLLLPTFNDAQSLARCLQSVVDQDYGDLMVLGLDNHSSDETYDILQDFEKHYRDRIYSGRMYANVSHHELTDQALRLANPRTIYLQFLRPTDVLLPGYISRCVERFENQEQLGCILSHADIITPAGEIRSAAPFLPEDRTLIGADLMEIFMANGLELNCLEMYRTEVYYLSRQEGLLFNRFPTWLPKVMACSRADLAFQGACLGLRGDSQAVLGDAYLPSLEDLLEHYVFLQAFNTIARRLGRDGVCRQLPTAIRRLAEQCNLACNRLLDRGDPRKAFAYHSLALAYMPEQAEDPAFRETAARLSMGSQN